MKNAIVITVLALATGVLAVIVFQQRSELAELRASVEQLSAPKPPPLPRPVRKPAPAPAPMPVEQPTPAPAPASAERKPANFLSRFAAMAKDPAFRDMMRAQQKMGTERMFHDLFEKLGLNDADKEHLKELLGERQMALMDAGMKLIEEGATMQDRTQRAKEVNAIKATHDKKIEEFLGAEDYATFRAYEETQGERMQVNMFKRSLAEADALSAQQETDLIAMMHQLRQSLPTPLPSQTSMPDPAIFTPEKINELGKQLEQLQAQYVEKAGTILTPTQLEKFKTSVQQMQSMQTMGLKMAAQFFGEQKP